jgi:YidC/Oxa1 family membrane protein insertase
MAELWNGLLSGLGAVLSFFYDIIPSYGVAIILLTIFVRVLLLPLTLKQTRSMHAMQQIQPQVKELQRKYKGNRQKLNEELMKLYKEHQVNPLGGCLPLLLQLPVFFALYRVLTGGGGTQYIPDGSLKASIIEGSQRFLGMNLGCSPRTAGQGMIAVVQGGSRIDCGDGTVSAIPYYIMVALMVGTTFYQQRQMSKASSGPQAQQMKIMTTIMPVFLGFISLQIAAGVLVYWVTTNSWQIAQQAIMLRKRAAADGSTTVKAQVKSDQEPKQEIAKGNGQKSTSKGGSKGGNARSRKKRRKR